MFPNLNAEMGRKNFSIKSLSGKTGIKYDSLKNKIRGDTEFKRSEMLLIKKCAFPETTLDYLFSTEDEVIKE